MGSQPLFELAEAGLLCLILKGMLRPPNSLLIIKICTFFGAFQQRTQADDSNIIRILLREILKRQLILLITLFRAVLPLVILW